MDGSPAPAGTAGPQLTYSRATADRQRTDSRATAGATLRAMAEATDAGYSWLRRSPERPPLIVAHRGASGLAPENTLAAFRLALAQGAPAVECDVHLTLDGAPIVIHDDRVDRTTSGNGEVATQTYQALRALDAGAWFGASFAGERLPALAEVLSLCAGHARAFVELKVGGGSALVNAALTALAGSPETAAAIISFDPEIVAEVHRRRPSLALGLLVGARQIQRNGVSAVIQRCAELGAGFLAPQASAVDQPLVAVAHAAGLPVSVWTVDNPDQMASLSAMGVDAITSNRPDVARHRLGA